ncbi:DUF2867 domain-containing protein [Agromyces laixinhei]|uniref:DUF2867 domain-containing protein n=1 Tax=Agromyces laixinhei TaxID=2585717 RepID=UPI0012ECF4E4|nr:DUF2867 domain-containing protein [Agromyces laixinhei]
MGRPEGDRIRHPRRIHAVAHDFRAKDVWEFSEPDLAETSLLDADYADEFALITCTAATPEQWARAMFGDIPTVAERLIWRGLLGIRLSRGRSARTIAGWRIAERGDRWIRLEADSWFLSANLIVRTTGDGVSLTTVVRYDRSIGRVIWAPLSAIHRRLIPGVLRSADEIRAPRRRESDSRSRATQPSGRT